MERPIGDRFIYGTVELEVVPYTNDKDSACKGCFFLQSETGCSESKSYSGECWNRNDDEVVIFRRVE